ncbi:MAG: sugar transferase [Hyphomicrobiaceae bacterium]
MTDARDASGALLPDTERLPRFGASSRASSLDELPELWNVLKGEMSLVGPRPLLVEYLGRYSPEQARRHEMPPGITGWAQVNGRNALDWPSRFALDVWYVDNWSLALDLRILWLTIARVLNRDGVSAEGHATMPPSYGQRAGRGGVRQGWGGEEVGACEPSWDIDRCEVRACAFPKCSLTMIASGGGWRHAPKAPCLSICMLHHAPTHKAMRLLQYPRCGRGRPL